MLSFNHFEKSYSTELVLSIPNLKLMEGIYWLQGENGAGKTTLLKSIAGLIPFTGSIAVQETEIRQHRKRYRSLVNWADAEPLYPDFLTGIDLIQFYLQTKGSSELEAEHIIQDFGVQKFMHQTVNTYSSGMTKKLSLALAFIGQPKWILLDEPLITLDVAAVQTCLSLIDRYHKNGVSFLITSHQSFVEAAHFQIKYLHLRNKTLELL